MFYPKSPFINDQLAESQIFKRNPEIVKDNLEWICKTPKTTTYRINKLKASTNVFIEELQIILSKKYGEDGPSIFKIDEIPEMVCITNTKSSVVYKSELKEIIIDCCCGAAVLRGAHIYAPGVMSMQTGTKLDEEVNVFADLEGKCKRGTNCVYNSDLKIFIGTGRTRMQRHQLFKECAQKTGVAIKMMATISKVPCIGDLSSSIALLQNFPSIVCVHVLDPKPGETILDMCSAPGNKTTHIAELMSDDGILIALDKTESKIHFVRQKIKDRQLNSVKSFAFDSTKALDTNLGKKNTILNHPPYAAGVFDRILLDAPCSGLGNRPVLSNKFNQKILQSYPKLQRKLFINAVGLLKPGGYLVYSTCTITEAENEEIVKWALDEFPEIKLVESSPIFGSPGLPNLGLSDNERKLIQRFSSKKSEKLKSIDSVGFFIAKFEKVTTHT